MATQELEMLLQRLETLAEKLECENSVDAIQAEVLELLQRDKCFSDIKNELGHNGESPSNFARRMIEESYETASRLQDYEDQENEIDPRDELIQTMARTLGLTSLEMNFLEQSSDPEGMMRKIGVARA